MILVLAGCEAKITGVVRSGGAPVAGATLHADALEADCDAVTGDDGAFKVRCARGAWDFAIRHPDHLDGARAVDVEGDVDLGTTELVRIPDGPGLHLLVGAKFEALSAAHLLRVATPRVEERWCVQGSPRVTGPTTRILDNLGSEWRVYRLDAEGCALRMRPGAGEHWSFAADRVPVAPAEGADGRRWADLTLTPGDYVIADWYAGFFVREDASADTWRGTWIRVP